MPYLRKNTRILPWMDKRTRCGADGRSVEKGNAGGHLRTQNVTTEQGGLWKIICPACTDWNLQAQRADHSKYDISSIIHQNIINMMMDKSKSSRAQMRRRSAICTTAAWHCEKSSFLNFAPECATNSTGWSSSVLSI